MKRFAMVLLGIIMGLLLLIVIAAAFSGGSNPEPHPTTVPATTPNPPTTQPTTDPTTPTPGPGNGAGGLAASAAQKAAPEVIVLGEGDYEVGTKTDLDKGTIAPGTYKVTAGYNCYWARVKGFSGEIDDIIANGNVGSGATVRVTVKKSDKGLTLSGDCKARR